MLGTICLALTDTDDSYAIKVGERVIAIIFVFVFAFVFVFVHAWLCT